MATPSDDKKYSSIHYNSYLQLDKLLDAQSLRSVEVGDKPAHDEMLFIITHQVYELWFKQINYELKAILKDFNADRVNEKNIGIAVSGIHRIVEILKVLIQQIGVLETMTPLDFLDFRNYLFPASGFQSFQFREFEVLLGLKEEKRHTYNNKPYHVVFDDQKKHILEELEHNVSLFEAVEAWLERTPFLNFSDFDFLVYYKKALDNMLLREKQAIEQTDVLSQEFKEMRLRMLGDTKTYFATILDENHHNNLIKEGKIHLSYKATVAALFISLYRDEPILHLPFKLLSSLVEMDDHITTWRYRHAQMVMRMLGKKVGTGGSSGHEYLSETASRHHIYRDLHNVSTLLIPRSDLPELPAELRNRLGFVYSMS